MDTNQLFLKKEERTKEKKKKNCVAGIPCLQWVLLKETDRFYTVLEYNGYKNILTKKGERTFKNKIKSQTI